jgi:hypothetical protein
MLRLVFNLSLIVLLATCSSEEKEKKENEKSQKPTPIHWGLALSTIQLINETVNPQFCPSGWTILKDQLEAEEKGYLVPLQSSYVKRFKNLEEFTSATNEAFSLVGKTFPTLRFSLVWPCWNNLEWREKVKETLSRLQEKGWQLEIALYHHDSYPAFLQSEGMGKITSSGWANPRIIEEFSHYTEIVIAELRAILPEKTIVYLSHEPVSYLFNAYLGSGIWPPGGKRAGKSFATALFNLRETMRKAASLVKEANWQPALSLNLRPTIGIKNETDRTLDYLFNWWLPKAVIEGCLDNDFDEVCEKTIPASEVKILGLSFYGSLSPSSETVVLTDQGKAMSLPLYDFSPNAQLFEETLRKARDLFPKIEIRVSEIGFSAAKTETMIQWFRQYREVIEELFQENLISQPVVQVHTLFESAEFSPGDWVFHLVEGCNEKPCQLTDWGKALINEIQ